jgi:hypothetical protein
VELVPSSEERLQPRLEVLVLRLPRLLLPLEQERRQALLLGPQRPEQEQALASMGLQDQAQA